MGEHSFLDFITVFLLLLISLLPLHPKINLEIPVIIIYILEFGLYDLETQKKKPLIFKQSVLLPDKSGQEL